MSTAQPTSALDVLPAEMRTLVMLATAPNATKEMQVAAAKSIIEGTPIGALKAFMYCVICHVHAQGGYGG